MIAVFTEGCQYRRSAIRTTQTGGRRPCPRQGIGGIDDGFEGDAVAILHRQIVHKVNSQIYDGDIRRDDAVATVFHHNSVRISARLAVHLIVELQHLTFAQADILYPRRQRRNRQIDMVNRIAAEGAGDGIAVPPRFCIGFVVNH